MTKTCDLFVYSRFSHPNYSLSPQEIYTQAKRVGMDFVTLSDVNTIDGCLEFLNRHPDTTDFMIGETVSCAIPKFKTTFPIGVYGLTEAHHLEITKRRGCLEDLLPYLKENHVTAVLGHPLYRFPAPAHHPDYLAMLLRSFEIIEVHHRKVIDAHNIMMAYFIKGLKVKGICGGSHAISKAGIGKTYTVCQGADPTSWLSHLRQGLASTNGEHAATGHIFRENQQTCLSRLKSLMNQRQYRSLPKALATVPFYSLKQTWQDLRSLKREQRNTPLYSSLLGASLKSVCFIPFLASEFPEPSDAQETVTS